MPTVIKSINDLNKILEQRTTMAMKMAQKVTLCCKLFRRMRIAMAT